VCVYLSGFSLRKAVAAVDQNTRTLLRLVESISEMDLIVKRHINRLIGNTDEYNAIWPVVKDAQLEKRRLKEEFYEELNSSYGYTAVAMALKDMVDHDHYAHNIQDAEEVTS
jgi:hypothetical protein